MEFLTRTPPYVWAILAFLMFLGIRRLKPRRIPLRIAAAAPIGFFAWSLATVVSLASRGDPLPVLATAILALIVGAASARIRNVPRPEPLPGGVFAFAGTAVPLIVYMAVFVAKYALQVWGAIVPASAGIAALIGLALTTAITGRTAADFIALLKTKHA